MARLLAEGYTGEKKTFAQDPWPELYEAMRLGLIMQGKVSGIEKSGGEVNLVVFIGPIKGIIPEEEIGLAEGQRPQFAVGNTVAFKVKHCDRAAGIVYLSRKEAMDEMSSRTWQELKIEAKELIELSERLRELKQKLNPGSTKDEEGDNKEDVSEEIPDLVAEETVELTDKEKEEIQKEIKEIQEKMRK